MVCECVIFMTSESVCVMAHESVNMTPKSVSVIAPESVCNMAPECVFGIVAPKCSHHGFESASIITPENSSFVFLESVRIMLAPVLASCLIRVLASLFLKVLPL